MSEPSSPVMHVLHNIEIYILPESFSLYKSLNPDIIPAWTFYDWVGVRGKNEIREWLDGLPVKAAAKIDARIVHMMAVEVWAPQYVSALTGWSELVELRVVSAGNQYRPIGFYGPRRKEFTLLLGAIEKGKLTRRVLSRADSNRKLVVSDHRYICQHVFAKGTAAT